MLKSNDRVDGVAVSKSVVISEEAAFLHIKGHDVLALNMGELDVPTPPHNCEAVFRAQNVVPQGLSSGIFSTDMCKTEPFLSARGADCGIAKLNIGPSGSRELSLAQGISFEI